MARKSSLVKAGDLKSQLNDKDLVLIDARTGPGVREKYQAEHLKGARFADLETELSKKTADAADGGRHPLPPVKEFALLLGKLGIDKSKKVIVYDDKSGANAAARFWWMLKAVGHENVQVLDGGYKAALEAGVPVSNESPVKHAVDPYPVSEWQLPVADANEVSQAANDPKRLVIDVREGFRFKGESEPIDTVAGHIPGAVNVPYINNLDKTGEFLPAAELAEKYKALLNGRSSADVIVHCGSGVTACHTLLAMDEAGAGIPALYVGSWSEWSRNDRPIATGEK